MTHLSLLFCFIHAHTQSQLASSEIILLPNCQFYLINRIEFLHPHTYYIISGIQQDTEMQNLIFFKTLNDTHRSFILYIPTPITKTLSILYHKCYHAVSAVMIYNLYPEHIIKKLYVLLLCLQFWLSKHLLSTSRNL